LLLVSGAFALGGLLLGVMLWHARWPALAIDAAIRLCG
jgi:hypothetical protein